MSHLSYFSLLYIIFIIFKASLGDVNVKTNYGVVQGERDADSFAFLGIPYATPPVGNLRWRSPVPPTPWSPDKYRATNLKPACPQKYCSHYLPSCPNVTSEDCLYLNIWTPLTASNASAFPVMVFLHGGAFKFSSADSALYDGNHLVKFGQVILVTLDYRLGLLGFLYTGDGPDDSHGNFGIQDQRLAMQWVKNNIRNFGGDPDKITLFGQSAGAQSVFVHVMSTKSTGLFRNAIVESAPFAVPYRYKGDALILSKTISRLLKCPDEDMVCLRSKTVDEISDVQQRSVFRPTSPKFIDYFEPFGPVIDGDEVHTQPLYAASAGFFQNVPMMLGTVTEEGRLFVYGVSKIPLLKPAYEAAIELIKPAHEIEIYQKYPAPENNTDCRDVLSQLASDYLFTCATQNASLSIIKQSTSPVYRYVFDHVSSGRGGWGRDTFCEGHVCHAEELGYVFGNHPNRNISLDEIKLSEKMMTYWTNFAYTSSPNDGPHKPDIPFPLYTSGKPWMMHFKTPENQYLKSYRQEYCSFWDKIRYDF